MSPVLIVAIGATLVVLTGEIDISVGSRVRGLQRRRGPPGEGWVPMPLVLAVRCVSAGSSAPLNGALVASLGIPSIVVTLATMVAFATACDGATEGAWVQDLPASFQWFGLRSARIRSRCASIVPAGLGGWVAWPGRPDEAGRAVYATGSNPEARDSRESTPALVDVLRLHVRGRLHRVRGVAQCRPVQSDSQQHGNRPGDEGRSRRSWSAARRSRGGRGHDRRHLLGVGAARRSRPALTFLGVQRVLGARASGRHHSDRGRRSTRSDAG